jgi:hypothetical protein
MSVIDVVKTEARGNWPQILACLGVVGGSGGELNINVDKNVVCPGCGGSDRFTFDDKNGDGTFYCRHLDGAGDGIGLVAHVREVGQDEAAKIVAEHLNISPTREQGFSKSKKSTEIISEKNPKKTFSSKSKKTAQEIFDESVAISELPEKNSAVMYLFGRGLDASQCSDDVRFHSGLPWWKKNSSQNDLSKIEFVGSLPTLIYALRSAENGELVTVHKTALSDSGTKHPDLTYLNSAGKKVSEVKKIHSSLKGEVVSCLICDALDASESPAFSEGLENGLSARSLGYEGEIRAFSSSAVAKRYRPNHFHSMTIIQDNDRAGEKLVEIIEKNGIKVDVVLPERADLNDDLLAGATSLPWKKDKNNDVDLDFPIQRPNGYPKDHYKNFKLILEHEDVKIRYNEMSKDIEVKFASERAGLDLRSEADLAEITDLCVLHNMGVGGVARHIVRAADLDTYHPAREWLDSVSWDGTEDAFQELIQSVGVNLDMNPKFEEILPIYLKRWLVQCVAAVYESRGIMSRGMLVFQGDQGIGKTTWIKSLLPEPDWVLDGVLLDPTNKDSVLQCISRWIVELGELDSTFRKSDISAIKAFTGRNKDSIRRPYAKTESQYPRRTIFYGSVNDLQFLNDDTGSTRYWCVPVSSLNFSHKVNLEQLWGFAKNLYEEGEQWYLTQDEELLRIELNDHFESENPLETRIISTFNLAYENISETYVQMKEKEELTFMSNVEIAEALGFSAERIGLKTTREISKALTKILGASPTKIDRNKGVKGRRMPLITAPNSMRTGSVIPISKARNKRSACQKIEDCLCSITGNTSISAALAKTISSTIDESEHAERLKELKIHFEKSRKAYLSTGKGQQNTDAYALHQATESIRALVAEWLMEA